MSRDFWEGKERMDHRSRATRHEVQGHATFANLESDKLTRCIRQVTVEAPTLRPTTSSGPWRTGDVGCHDAFTGDPGQGPHQQQQEPTICRHFTNDRRGLKSLPQISYSHFQNADKHPRVLRIPPLKQWITHPQPRALSHLDDDANTVNKHCCAGCSGIRSGALYLRNMQHASAKPTMKPTFRSQ